MRAIRIKNCLENSESHKWTLLKRNCFADGLFSQFADVRVNPMEKLTRTKKNCVIKSKRNAEFRA